MTKLEIRKLNLQKDKYETTKWVSVESLKELLIKMENGFVQKHPTQFLLKVLEENNE